MGNNNNSNCLDELVKNLEMLPNLNQNSKTNEIIDKINRNYSLCINFFENYKNKNEKIFEDSYINDYYRRVENKMNHINQDYLIYFKSVLDLIDKIKSHNEKIKAMNSYIQDSNLGINNNNINQEPNQFLIEKQIQKQDIIQVQELQLLNDNQGRALSALECYSNRFNSKPTKYFDFYNLNNLSSKKKDSELRNQCIVQIQLFRMTYNDYIQKYGSYKVDNLDNKKLKEIINNWKEKVRTEDKVLYDDMLSIIFSKNINSSSNLFNTYSKKCQNVQMNPRDIASIAPGVYNYNHQRSNQAQKKYLETGKKESKLNIGKSYKDDKDAENLMKGIKKNKEYFEYEYDLDENGDNK